MAEYINVEKPFLDKLQFLGWKVINQGIPQEPEKNLVTTLKKWCCQKSLKKVSKP